MTWFRLINNKTLFVSIKIDIEDNIITFTLPDGSILSAAYWCNECAEKVFSDIQSAITSGNTLFILPEYEHNM